MGARTLMIVAALAGSSIAGCAPTVDGSGERGGTVREYQFQLAATPNDALAAAGKYCAQFGRSAHIASEDVGILRIDTFDFDCVE